MTPGQRAAAALTALILACLTGWAAAIAAAWAIWQLIIWSLA